MLLRPCGLIVGVVAVACGLLVGACSAGVDADSALLTACQEAGHRGTEADVAAGRPFVSMRFLAGGEEVIEPGDPASRDHPTVGVDENRAWYGVLERDDGVCVALAYRVDLDGWVVEAAHVRVRAEDVPPGSDEPDDFKRDLEFAGELFSEALIEDGVDPDVPLMTAWANLPGCVAVSVSIDLKGPGGAVTNWFAHGRYGRDCRGTA